MSIMWKVDRIPAGDITNLLYNFLVAKPLVAITASLTSFRYTRGEGSRYTKKVLFSKNIPTLVLEGVDLLMHV